MPPRLTLRCFTSLARIKNKAASNIKHLTAIDLDPYATIPSKTFFPASYAKPNKTHENISYLSKEPDSLGLRDTYITMSNYFRGDLHYTQKVFSGQHQNYKQGQKVEQRTFVDLRVVRLQSGKGGNGCVSFFRDASRPVGPPDGGDGGDGGNIYIQVVNSMGLLHKVKRTYISGNGKPGTASQLDGKRGDDIILEIPVGTTMRWIPDPVFVKDQGCEEGKDLADVSVAFKMSKDKDIQLFKGDYVPGEGWQFKEKDEEYHREKAFFNELDVQVKDYDREIIAEELMFDKFPLEGIDFDKPTEKPMLILKGGKGGMGNMHFLTPNIRNPRFSKQGRLGVSEFFLLELKLIADLGLVGLPNAGKLSLLRAISKARPRVGHWEFTTLQPTIGTIFTRIDQDPFTVADIPGIIKGASQNKGMGLDFLRHVERSGGLIFVVSLESTKPVSDLKLLIEEIGERRMANKRVMVIATKADLVSNGARYAQLQDYITRENKAWRCIPVCAPKGENINECILMMGEMAKEGKEAAN